MSSVRLLRAVSGSSDCVLLSKPLGPCLIVCCCRQWWGWGRSNNATAPTASAAPSTVLASAGLASTTKDTHDSDEDEEENLFASLGALEQRSLLLLLCYCAGPEHDRSEVEQQAVLLVANACNLQQGARQEIERQGTRQCTELAFILPAGMGIGPRRVRPSAPAEWLVVTNVVPNGSADKAGLVTGDVVESIDGRTFGTTSVASEHLKKRAAEGQGAVLQLVISRKRSEMPRAEAAALLEANATCMMTVDAGWRVPCPWRLPAMPPEQTCTATRPLSTPQC